MTRKFSAVTFSLCLLITPRATFGADTTTTAPFAETTERREAGDADQKLLAKENFAGIEKLAAELRSQKTHASDGLWSLSLMYQAVHLDGKDQLDADFEAELALMRKWQATIPDSITRPVAAAQASQRRLLRDQWL